MQYILLFIMMLSSMMVLAGPATKRIAQLDNERVAVWETIVYPEQSQILKMHRHDRDRVLVALTDGTLKVTNDKGQSHLLVLRKDHAYYLTRDIPGEMHQDQNISGHLIKTMVIELKDTPT